MKYPHFREMLTKNINEADILLGSASYDLSCSCGSGTSEAPKRLRELSSYLPCYDANFHLLSDVKIYDYCDVSPKNGVASFYQELEEKAKEMLIFTDESIASIAASVGYTDQNYFARIFKRFTGFPPSKIR